MSEDTKSYTLSESGLIRLCDEMRHRGSKSLGSFVITKVEAARRERLLLEAQFDNVNSFVNGGGEYKSDDELYEKAGLEKFDDN